MWILELERVKLDWDDVWNIIIGLFKPLSPNIHKQIIQTGLHTFH